MIQVLENMDGYVVSLNRFYKMEESDWVVMRLIYDNENECLITGEQGKAIHYLIDKYGAGVFRECVLELHRSVTGG